MAPSPMTRTLALAATLLVGSISITAAAHAQNAPQQQQPGQRRVLMIPKLSPEQQLKLFPGRKALLQQEQRERVAILQRSQGCVNRASTPDALRDCLMQERRDTQALRSRFMTEMRQLFEKNGISFPQLDARPLRRGEPSNKGVESI